MPKGDESVWDIRGDLSLCISTVPMSTCAASAKRCGIVARQTSPAGKTFASDDKITAVYRQFLLANDWRQPANQLTLSAASSLLLTHLIQHYSTVQWRLPTVTGGLAPGVKRHVLAWIDAHLDQPLTLADLAQQAGLSEFHFARMFRQSLNMAPHQYVMQQRMARAQNLLCQRAAVNGDCAGLRLQLRQPFQPSG
ncbi:AraC family transcriptional regulator [Klebsiella variicola subsp. variicola]|nr:AraC family transcriptional regulator [Klebsiella variicola subsp. variicola]